VRIFDSIAFSSVEEMDFFPLAAYCVGLLTFGAIAFLTCYE